MTPKKQKNKVRLFQTALTLFSQNGFQKTTIEAVAQQTGMTKGNIYFYVRDKKDLYHQTIHWALTQWQDHVSRSVANAGTPKDQFIAMAQSALGYIRSSRILQDLLVKDPEIFTLDRKKDRFPEANRAALDIIEEILASGIAQGLFSVKDPEATARYLFSIYMMFLIQNYVYLDQKDFQRIFNAALELSLRGLLSTP
jgi:AcrR family transcriptional regulator